MSPRFTSLLSAVPLALVVTACPQGPVVAPPCTGCDELARFEEDPNASRSWVEVAAANGTVVVAEVDGDGVQLWTTAAGEAAALARFDGPVAVGGLAIADGEVLVALQDQVGSLRAVALDDGATRVIDRSVTGPSSAVVHGDEVLVSDQALGVLAIEEATGVDRTLFAVDSPADVVVVTSVEHGELVVVSSLVSVGVPATRGQQVVAGPVAGGAPFVVATLPLGGHVAGLAARGDDVVWAERGADGCALRTAAVTEDAEATTLSTSCTFALAAAGDDVYVGRSDAIVRIAADGTETVLAEGAFVPERLVVDGDTLVALLLLRDGGAAVVRLDRAAR